MFLACPKPKFFKASEIELAEETVCSLKNVLMAVYKAHCTPRTYTLSTEAAGTFSLLFTEFRTTVELATKKDTCIR